jgi:filamentous hemagglutinin family protein
MKNYIPLLFVALNGFAGLSSPAVMRGDASVQHADGHWDIQVSDRAVIQWENFSLSELESAQFHQPNSLSVVVNRCLGEKSEIFGKLIANGHLVLVNPNGVYFGENSWVETAKFTASTFDLFEEGLSGDRLCFEKESQEAIVAGGKIIAHEGNILLLSPQVTTSGDLSAPNGEICSGDAYIKKEDEFGWIRIKPTVGIDVQGVIRANSVTLLSDGNLFDLAINHEGIIEANTISFEGGKVLFKGDDGKVAISGKIETAQGGEIALFGKEIEVAESAHLISPEGNVYVGGGFHGKDSERANADKTVMNGTIDVSSKGDQKGGSVVLWSENKTDFFGRISATGGDRSGDGGLIEVSSKGTLTYRGKASAASPCGKAGLILLDPSTITIGGAASAPALTTPIYDPAVAIATVLAADISAALGGGSDVTIQTSAGVGGTGDITLLGGFPITWATANAFALIADNDITILSDITSTAGGPIQLLAAQDVFIGPPVVGMTSLLSSVTPPAPIDVRATAGGITVTGGTTGGFDSGILDCLYYDVRCGGDILLTCSTDGNAVLQSTASPDLCSISCGGNLTCFSSGLGSTSIHAFSAPISMFVGGNLTFDQQSTDNSGTNFGVPGTNSTIFVGGNFLISKTSTGNMFVDVGGDTTFTVQGSMTINDTGPGGFVGILDSSAGTLLLDVGADINISIASPGPFKGIGSAMGPLTILTQGSLSANGAAFIGSGGGDVFIQCDRDCLINGTSTVSVFAPAFEITIVTDNDFPTAPGIGPGRFVLGPNATINSMTSSPVRIFTATQAQNSILGSINLSGFNPGTLYIDTDQERWGVYFPNAFVNPNSPFFTIFYKDTPALLTFLAEPVFEFDISRYLHPYDEYISLANRFFEGYSEGSYEPTAFQPYFLRKRTLRYTSFTPDRDNIEYSFIY